MTKYIISPEGVSPEGQDKWEAAFEKRVEKGNSFETETIHLGKVFENKEDAKSYAYSYLIKSGIKESDVFEEK